MSTSTDAAPKVDAPGQGPLWETAATATDYWNDSCSIEELSYAIERGAVGATSNPTIVGDVLKKEMHLWRDRIGEIIAENPTATEDEVAWRLIEEMAVRASELLMPVFEREQGRKGRLSIQTNPKFYRDSARLTEQGLRFASLAPNMQIKIPATAAGIDRDRRGHRRRRVDQRDGVLHRPPGAGGCRGRQARPRAPRGCRRGHRGDVAGVHDHGRPPRRLDGGAGQARQRGDRPRRRALGRHRRLQARLRHLSAARLPHPAARRRLPPPPALVRADRR